MRHYEIVYLVAADKNAGSSGFIKEAKSFILANGGSFYRYEIWGEHELSYKIEGAKSAFFYCLNIRSTCQLMLKLEEKFKGSEVVLRHLITKLNSKPAGKSSFLSNLESTQQNKDEKKDKGTGRRTRNNFFKREQKKGPKQ